MNEWIKSFVGYVLIISVAMQMVPNTKYEQYIRLFAGFLLLVLLIQPILKIGSVGTYLEEQITEVIAEQERLEAEIVMQSREFEVESQQLQENELTEMNIQQIEPVEVEVNVSD